MSPVSPTFCISEQGVKKGNNVLKSEIRCLHFIFSSPLTECDPEAKIAAQRMTRRCKDLNFSTFLIDLAMFGKDLALFGKGLFTDE